VLARIVERRSFELADLAERFAERAGPHRAAVFSGRSPS
jgi:hypothetical protein